MGGRATLKGRNYVENRLLMNTLMKYTMNLLKGILKTEAGQALPMALILLLLGGFLVVPSLVLMTTSLTANRQIDRANLELYAADAGVENVLWNIQNDPGMLPAQGNTLTLNLQDQAINGMSSVVTTIENLGNHIYRINSTATSAGGHTEVVTSISCLNFSNLLEGAITSNGDVTIRNSTITGKVYYADDKSITGSTLVPPDPIQETQTNWPTWDDLSPLYLSQVAGHDYTSPNPLYINEMPVRELGPTYLDGSLTVDNTGTAGLTLTLTGTIYVTENLIFAQAKNYTINLNGHTMFVYGTPDTKDPTKNKYAIDFPSNSITLMGSGCIIADGNINFQPGMSASPTDFVLVMSLAGKTTMSPTGNFYGSLVGEAAVELQNGYLEWNDPSDNGLNFPGTNTGIEGASGEAKVLTYTIQ